MCENHTDGAASVFKDSICTTPGLDTLWSLSFAALTAFPLPPLGEVRVIRAQCVHWALIGIAALPYSARAHSGRAPEPHDLWHAWTVSPTVFIGLVIALWLYARGLGTFSRERGSRRVVGAWRVASFAGGVMVVAIALLSPLDAVSAALFSAHMIQHMLLIVVAAPLLLLGHPERVMLWALDIDARRRVGLAWRHAHTMRAVWHWLRRPLVAWLLHVITLWLWHVPALYDAAFRDERIHVAEHASFFLSALLFWSLLIERQPRYRLGAGVGALYLFAAALQCTLLGALIAVAHRPWYVVHYGTTTPWGLTPLEDQQIAGLIMWIPASLAYLVALIPTVLPALRSPTPPTYRCSASPTIAGVSVRGTP
jgi:cytochrome c oxidase assembly factor CtaG